MSDNFLPEGYADIKAHALIVSFRELLKKTGRKKAVIGVSGGVDSALAAALISRAIGPENTYPLFMPYKTSDTASAKDARALADKFSLDLETIDITPAADAFFHGKEASPLRRGNAMARLRMAFLFDKAQAEDAIVAGTSNKTEILLGYGTWFGDTASSINILGSLYKREVFAISRLQGVPEPIINKKPTADLWEGQTDEEELGFSYEDADRFLYAAFEEKLERPVLEKIFGSSLTDKILTRVVSNAFKRKMPLICGCSDDFFAFVDKRSNEII